MGRKKKTGGDTATETRTVRPTHDGVMATWSIGDRTGRVPLLRAREYEVVDEDGETLTVRCPVSGHSLQVVGALVEPV